MPLVGVEDADIRALLLVPYAGMKPVMFVLREMNSWEIRGR